MSVKSSLYVGEQSLFHFRRMISLSLELYASVKHFPHFFSCFYSLCGEVRCNSCLCSLYRRSSPLVGLPMTYFTLFFQNLNTSFGVQNNSVLFELLVFFSWCMTMLGISQCSVFHIFLLSLCLHITSKILITQMVHSIFDVVDV